MNDLPTDPERWRKVEALLDQVLDLPPEERAAFLDAACDADDGRRAAVEALLAADARAGSFLDVPAGEYAAELWAELPPGDSDALPAGRQIGPYRLLRELGSGGMGVVYEAEDPRLGRRVALKFLPPEYSRDHGAKDRFLREARATSALDHPNLCTVHDVGESDGRLYIVLAFYEGETLRQRLERGPLPPAEAREVALQLARGLACAHEAGIVHRDIKPANVILTRRGEAKILDFGVAKLRGDLALTETGVSPGTPAYMSPEQARGESVDARADVWSLGVMLHEMLTGRRPTLGEGVERLPPELAPVVARALAPDPAERYPSAAELLADLAPGSAPDRPRRRRLRSRALPAGPLAAAAALLLAAGLGWLLPRLSAGPARRVALLNPAVSSAGEDSELAFVPGQVVEAALATLTSLEGVQPLDPPRRDEGSGSEVERLRAAEADEVLLALLDCREDWCRVSLRRLREPGGAVLATVGPFEVQAGIENALRLAEAVGVQVRRLYPRHRPRRETPGRQIRPQDHAALSELERQVDRGERLGGAELDRLDALLRTSPDLLGAYQMGADVARLAGELDRAHDYAGRAHRLAPHDPGPLFSRFRIEMAAGLPAEARATLEQLSRVAPGDARVLSAEADLLETQGELGQARRRREEVARRRPHWQPILELATLELRLGESTAARRRLESLLATRPDSQYVRETLAFIEGSYGDLEHAAALYEELIGRRPARPYLTNLGFVRFLLGDFAAAEAAYHRALALEPGHLLTRINLAASLAAQGKRVAAQRDFAALAEELAAAPAPLDVRTRMLHAQCLARLGRRAEALRLAEEVLRQVPEDAQGLHQAAQLYALLGERLPALYYTERALQKGLRREWFEIPELAALAADPDFRALLDAPLADGSP